MTDSARLNRDSLQNSPLSPCIPLAAGVLSSKGEGRSSSPIRPRSDQRPPGENGMQALTHWQRRFLRAGAALALLAGCLAAPSSVQASCGDYVTFGQPAHHPAAQPSPSAAPAGQPMPVKPPCQGPNCSRSPVPETPAPISTLSTASRAEQWGHLPGLVLPDGSQPAPALRHDNIPLPESRPSPIFHPPR